MINGYWIAQWMSLNELDINTLSGCLVLCNTELTHQAWAAQTLHMQRFSGLALYLPLGGNV